MNIKKRSIVWTGFSDEEFSDIIRTSKTQKEAVRHITSWCNGSTICFDRISVGFESLRGCQFVFVVDKCYIALM